jgi:hypothetical protein
MVDQDRHDQTHFEALCTTIFAPLPTPADLNIRLLKMRRQPNSILLILVPDLEEWLLRAVSVLQLSEGFKTTGLPATSRELHRLSKKKSASKLRPLCELVLNHPRLRPVCDPIRLQVQDGLRSTES